MPLLHSGDPPMLGFVCPRAWNNEGEDTWLAMITNVDPKIDHESLFDLFTQKSRYASWFKNGKRCANAGAPAICTHLLFILLKIMLFLPEIRAGVRRQK